VIEVIRFAEEIFATYRLNKPTRIIRVMRHVARGTDQRGEILIVTGPAASGKSSTALRIATESVEPSVHLHADDFFHALKVGRLRGWEEGATSQHEIVFEAIARAATTYAAGGYFVVVDSFIRPRYFNIVKETIVGEQIDLHVVVLRPSYAEAVTRSQKRDPSKRHDDSVFEELYHAFDSVGELETHVIDNSTFNEEETSGIVRTRYLAGQLRLLS
jgi:chloramphenicol 3-O-phosphotransferase